MAITLAPLAPAPRSSASRCYGQCTVLMRRGGGLTTADAALVTPYLPGTSEPYPDPLYGGPDATEALVFPVATGGDGVVALWADAPGRLELEAVHPVLGRARGVLDLEPDPDAAPGLPEDLARLGATQTFTGINTYTDEIHSDGGLVLNSTTYLANPMNIVGDQAILPDADNRGRLGSVTNRLRQVWTRLLDVADGLTVGGKPVAPSPDAGNALVWRANGLYSTDTTGGGGGGLATDPLADAKGDLFAAGGADAVGRLALGADGHVLTADSAQTLGVKWAAAAGGGGGLPTTGGAMTGPIASGGSAVQAGGALVVTGPGATATDAVLYGSSSPAFSPATTSASREYGLRFSSAAPQYLCAVRWYRSSVSAGATPIRAALWDSTAPATPVWSTTALAGWADGATGWKEQRLPAGTQPLLVAGRTYVLSYTASAAGGSATRQLTYTPVPDAGLTFATSLSNTTPGAYPATTQTDAYGLDGGFRASLSPPDPAEAGALRLPNGLAGRVAWRDGADGADLSLTMDAGDRLALAVGATALTTSATAGAASALPGVPAGYLTVVVNGTPVKLAYWSV